MKKITMLVIGAGGRGTTYAKFALEHPDMFQVVGVAEPIKERREKMQKEHNIPDEMCFDDWKPILDLPKCADMVVISTMDELHYEPCLKAIEKKYAILLEKPMAQSPQECFEIAKSAEENNVKIVVCHVLRFTEFFKKIKEIILSGKLGKIATVQHSEGVGNLHQSHSYVRGNWKNSIESAPMILTKSCHDTDIIQWLVGEKCKKIQSFGSLLYFNRENKPEGSPERCIDGCPYGETCYYNSVKLYLEDEKNDWFRGAATMLPNPTNADVEKALRETEYGKCVYNCSNDVVDHQVVNMLFEGGISSTFTMSAYNMGGRDIRIMGTKGELIGNAGDDHVKFFNFATRETEIIHVTDKTTNQDITGGHGGGDTGIMFELHKYLTEDYDGFSICDIGTTCDNHLIAFMAEKSRINEGTTIDIEKYKKELSK